MPIRTYIDGRKRPISQASHVVDQKRSLRQSADEVFGLVGAAGAFVLRFLRIGAERARAGDAAVRHLGGDDLFWRDAALAPLLERRERVEYAGTFAAGAMTHA